MKKRKVGRPISKPGRIKVGFSVSKETNDTLNLLAESSGKSKSKITEEALYIYNKYQGELYEKIKDITIPIV